MTTFQKLFGIKKSQVKNTCLLMPMLRKDNLKYLGIKELSKGILYSSGNNPSFTLIRTGIGPSLLGDAVLYLGETPCQNIIVLGSCGLVREEKNMDIGTLVTPSISYSSESFTDMLLKEKKVWKSFKASESLLVKFLDANKKHDIQKVTCASLGSLKLEEDYIDTLEAKNIQVVDMEASSLFSAAAYIHKKAMALFYITDIINKKPFYEKLDAKDRAKLSSSIKDAVNILCDFIQKNLNS